MVGANDNYEYKKKEQRSMAFVSILLESLKYLNWEVVILERHKFYLSCALHVDPHFMQNK